MNDFEKQLQRQPLRTLPPEWRGEILRAAVPAPAPPRRLISNFKFQISNLLWPCPQAWAGLAAAWLVILGLNFTSRTSPSPGLTAAKADFPLSPQVLALLREQRALYSELLGRLEASPPPAPPRPRSERTPTMMCG